MFGSSVSSRISQLARSGPRASTRARSTSSVNVRACRSCSSSASSTDSSSSSAYSRIVWSMSKRSVPIGLQQAQVDECRERVEIGVADLLGGLQRAAADEDGETAEDRLSLFVEQLVTPLDRGP